MRVERLRVPGLNRQVTLYLLHSGLFYIGLFGITDVMLNFYFVSLGHEAETIGILQGLPRLGGLLTGIPMGLLANRIGARRVTIGATIGAAITYPMMVIWPTLLMLAVSRFLLGLFYGATQVASAPLMMTLTASKYQTHQFSYHSVVTMSATSLGSLIAGALPALITRFGIPAQAVVEGVSDAQTPFAYGGALAISGLIIFISALPLWWLTETTTPRVSRKIASGRPEAPVRWANLVYLSLPYLFFGFTGGLTFPFYNLFFRTTFGASDQTVGTILSLGWLGMGLVTLTNPWWDKRFGRAKSLLITMSIAAAAFMMLSRAPTLGLSVVAFVVAISVRNMMSPLFQPLLMDSISAALRNLASSTGFVLWNIGYFAATMFGGFWQTQYGFPFSMQVVAVGALVTGLSIYLIFHNRQPYALQEG